MTRLRVSSVVLLALAALAAPGARAQSSKPASQPSACDASRYRMLRDILDENRTYEQEMEFEQLDRVCADAGMDNVRHARAAWQSAQFASKAAPAANGPDVLGRPIARAGYDDAEPAALGTVTAGATDVLGRPTSTLPAAERPEALEAAALRAVDVPQTPSAPARVRSAWDESPLRHGFWLSGGLGWGTLGCNDCGSRQSGLSGGISLGGTLSQHVQLGLSSNGWAKSQGGATISTGALTALIKLYPLARGGFYLLGGAGVSLFSASASAGGFGLTSTTTGEGAVVGLGYDVRVARKLSLTPFASGVGMHFDGGDFNFAQAGLAVTFH